MREHLAKLMMAWALSAMFMCSKAFADCLDVPDHVVEITVASCRVLDPEQDPTLRNYEGMTFGDRKEFLERWYRGALVKDTQGMVYVYPSKDPHVCDQFPKRATVKKMMGFTCCDTGRWGKCLYGGSWLWDVGGRPVNTFQ